MKQLGSLWLSVILTVTLMVAALCNAVGVWWIVGITAALLISIFMFVGQIRRLHSAIDNGYNLLCSQDFSSRLRPTGHPDADKLADLFNKLMATMKGERLRLMEQNLFMTKLIEVSPLGIAICDFDGRIIETNARYRDLITPALAAVLDALAADEVRMVRMDSAQIYRCSRLWFMDSGFRRSFFLIEVMTDEILSSERRVFSTIVRTIGHEVNNTFSPVVSLLDTLSEDPALSADGLVLDAIDGCKTSCLNLMEFVRGYASVVKISTPQLADTDLSAEINRLLPALRTLAGPQIDVVFHDDNRRIILPLDMVLIDRAIINIIKNSVESIGSNRNGRIAIHLNGSILSITDNGHGIRPEDSDRIFTPFFSTKRPDRGLGLMLVGDILRSHGARFSLTTESETRLTTFTIVFS